MITRYICRIAYVASDDENYVIRYDKREFKTHREAVAEANRFNAMTAYERLMEQGAWKARVEWERKYEGMNIYERR